MHRLSFKNVGPPNTPQEVRRLRRQNMDYQRRNGQPVVHKHRYNIPDLESGIAKRCPACWDGEYDQVRNNCEVCFGTGLVSVEDSTINWIDSAGKITTTPTNLRAPLYGGYAESFLTWLVEPDAAEDFFKLTNAGVLTRVQRAQGQAPWYPDMSDNDMIINVNLSPDGFSVEEAQERYELKMTNPQTVRSFGSKGGWQGHPQIGQQFEMVLIPEQNILQKVPIDNA